MGVDMQRHDVMHVEVAAPEPSVDLLSLNEALSGSNSRDPEKAQLVKLRYFAGLTIPEAAQALGISPTTADRHWAYARAWLQPSCRGIAEIGRARTLGRGYFSGFCGVICRAIPHCLWQTQRCLS